MARDNVWMKMLTVRTVYADVIQNSMRIEQEYAVSIKKIPRPLNCLAFGHPCKSDLLKTKIFH